MLRDPPGRSGPRHCHVQRVHAPLQGADRGWVDWHRGYRFARPPANFCDPYRGRRVVSATSPPKDITAVRTSVSGAGCPSENPRAPGGGLAKTRVAPSHRAEFSRVEQVPRYEWRVDFQRHANSVLQRFLRSRDRTEWQRPGWGGRAVLPGPLPPDPCPARPLPPGRFRSFRAVVIAWRSAGSLVTMRKIPPPRPKT